MKARRIAAVAAVVLGLSGLTGIASAGASVPPPTLTSSAPLYTIGATGYNYALSGPIHYAPHMLANCVGFPSASVKGLSLTVPGIGTVYLPADSCFVSDFTLAAEGHSSIAGANLLNGRIRVGAVQSDCVAKDDGVTTVGSTVASINGAPIGNVPGSLVIPGVASVYTNLNTETYDPESGVTTMQSIGVLIIVPAHTVFVLGKPVTVAAQTITLGECSVSGYLLT
jgi:hypothetical protein